MPDVESLGYAVIDGVIRKVKIFPGGVLRDGKQFVMAAPHNPKKDKPQDGATPQRFLIDQTFVSTSMPELAEKVKALRQDTLKALTAWSSC